MAAILVVEDEDSMARAATQDPGRAGHAPIVALNGTTAQQERVRLIFRLIGEGSERLARQVCDRVDTDRGRRQSDSPSPAPSWAELAHAGCQEGLLSDGEGALLAGCAATPVDAH
jgi:hypothetical protein